MRGEGVKVTTEEAAAFAVTCDYPIQLWRLPLDARVSERENASGLHSKRVMMK